MVHVLKDLITTLLRSRDLQIQISYLQEKASLLEKENFALKSQIELLQNTLSYERTRGEQHEEIYMKRLGLIIPPSNGDKKDAVPNPIRRGITIQELGRQLSRKQALETRAVQEYWRDKLRKQEEEKKKVIEDQIEREGK